jgi:hypothetical protein
MIYTLPNQLIRDTGTDCIYVTGQRIRISACSARGTLRPGFAR